MTTTISTKGQITLPAKFRVQDGIELGQEFAVERIARGEYRLTRKKGRPNEGVVDWLLSCPDKGWFQSLDRMETADDIKGPGFE